jgi:hypothetical protein
VLVCGGRDFHERACIFNTLDSVHARTPITSIIHGNATGADRIGGAWGLNQGIDVKPYSARWTDLDAPGAVIRTRADGSKYNQRAGHDRNELMLTEGKPDLVVAFPGCFGTEDMVNQAKRAGVKVLRIWWSG